MSGPGCVVLSGSVAVGGFPGTDFPAHYGVQSGNLRRRVHVHRPRKALGKGL